MKRTDAQRAFFQGLLVRWRSNHEFGVPWEMLSPDGICRTFHGSAVSSPRVFHTDDIYNTCWEIDVGKGYRLIDSAESCDGDEVWYYPGRKWIAKDSALLEPFSHRIPFRRLFFRRKVETEPKPEPEEVGQIYPVVGNPFDLDFFDRRKVEAEPEPEWEYEEWVYETKRFRQPGNYHHVYLSDLMDTENRWDGWGLVGFVFEWRGERSIWALPIAYGRTFGKESAIGHFYCPGDEVLRPTAALMRRKK